MAEREFNLIVYGATGFTGKLVSDDLYHRKFSKWAMAGRDLGKLKATLAEIQLTGKLEDIPLLVASPDQSLTELAGRTKVLINCAGPYGHTGALVVEACINAGTHYVDITGEPQFFLSSVKKFHEAAQKKGVCIIHGCGLDSIPWDLGVLYAIQGSSQRSFTKVSSVVAYGEFKIIPSTGTLLSGLDVLSRNFSWEEIVQVVDSWIPLQRKDSKITPLVPRIPVFPHYSPIVKQWVLPTMGTLDGLVVRRTARLLHEKDPAYPADFQFGQYIALGNLVNLILVLFAAFTLVPILFIIARIPPARAALTQFLRKTIGDGPSHQQRKKTTLKIHVSAVDESGTVVGKSCVSCPSDPAYLSTSKWIVDTAICLFEADKPSGGVYTTGSGENLGHNLINRLQKSNLAFEN